MKKPPFRLGIYPLGHENVELWIDPPDGGDHTGGWCQMQGFKGARPSIHLLLDPDDEWARVLFILLHETREFSANRLVVSYIERLRYDNSTSSRLFVYDHQQGSEMDMRQATFMSYCMKPLQRTYRKMRKKAAR